MESQTNPTPVPSERVDSAKGEPTPSLDLPRRFERFTLLKRIAQGGMGELYLASATSIEGAERPAVLKLIKQEHGADASFRARFLDEARIQAQLQHPGVAQILEAATDAEGQPYVVLEYIEGRNLAELRSRLGHMDLRINWPDTVAIGVSLGDALMHVHERTDAAGKPLEIAHRDLSPQNVMLSYHGDLKLVDFGTARGENRRSKTIKGVVFAKPGYVAPEVINQEPGGAPADLYAFGIILWELVAGRRFLSGDASTHMAEVGAGQRNPPSLAQSARIPRALDTIIQRLTAPRIQDRYASARQATADLVELLSTAPSPTGSDRSVRGRVAQLMQRLYPGEPARSRLEFQSLLAAAKIAADQPAPKPSRPPRQPKHPTELFPGTRYRLVRELGRGGMGVVHEAVHVDLDRRVALKVLTKDGLGGSLEMLRKEAQTIAGLKHKNLVKLYDFGTTDDGRPYYVMELLSGESLETKLRRNRSMDWKEAVALVRQACDALNVAHVHGVIHRDIKPANLFVLENGSLKLLDFGVAKTQGDVELDGRGSAAGSGPLSLTGTPEYASPEQARGKAADQRSDVYALGVVLYELITGKLPHDGSTTVALLDAKIRQTPKSPGECAPEQGLPRELNEILLRVLEPVPELRYQSAKELGEALGKIWKARVPGRRLPLARTLAATGAILAVAGLVALSGAGRSALTEVTAELRPLYETALSLGIEAKADPAREKGPRPDAPLLEPLEPSLAPTLALPQSPEAGPSEDHQAVAHQAAESTPLGAVDDAKQNAEEDDDDAARLEDDGLAAADLDPLPGEDTDKVSAAINRAADLAASGRKLKAFYLLKRVGLRNYSDPRALEAWSRAAADTKTWGEAVRVARRWTAVDAGPEPLLHLARMLRRAGNRKESIGTLYRLLRKHPDCAPAEEMLVQIYGRQPVVALAEAKK